MDGTAELLSFIYQNSQMGAETMDQLRKIAKDGAFRDFLGQQRERYLDFNRKAGKLLVENGYGEKGLGTFERLRTYLMINAQTMTDKSPSHMAQMLITGSTMGITDAVRKLRRYQGGEEEPLKLMRRLQEFEESSVEKLKEFL